MAYSADDCKLFVSYCHSSPHLSSSRWPFVALAEKGLNERDPYVGRLCLPPFVDSSSLSVSNETPLE